MTVYALKAAPPNLPNNMMPQPEGSSCFPAGYCLDFPRIIDPKFVFKAFSEVSSQGHLKSIHQTLAAPNTTSVLEGTNQMVHSFIFRCEPESSHQ